MISFTITLESIIPVFFIIFMGIIAGKLKPIKTHSLTWLLLNIIVPCLVFSELSKSSFPLVKVRDIGLSVLIIVTGTGLCTKAYMKLARIRVTEYLLPVMIMSYAYMNLPIITELYGDIVIKDGIIYYACMAFITYTLGIYIANPESGFKGILTIFRVPLIYSFFLGVFFSYMDFELFPYIKAPIKELGEVAMPLMAFVLGLKISELKIIQFQRTIMAVIIRFVGGLVFSIIAVWLLDLEGDTKNIIILGATMPSAFINFILAENYERDSELVASIVSLSYLLYPLVLILITSFVL